MISIGGANYTAAQVRGMIHGSPATVWHKSYPNYLLKISRSGNSFVNLNEVITYLDAYIIKEMPLRQDAVKLAKLRGNLPNNVGVSRRPITVASIRAEDQAAVTALLAGTADPTLADNGAHSTDPETGAAKANGISVKEYYINGASGRRAVRRVEGTTTTVYYSPSHAYNTYEYNLVVQ